MLLIPSPLYNPRHPHSDLCPHASILAPSSNYVTSTRHPLVMVVSFSIRVEPLLINFPTITFSPLHSPPLLPHFLTRIYLSLYIYISFSLSLFLLFSSSISCITSPLSHLMTYHSPFLIYHAHSLQHLSPYYYFTSLSLYLSLPSLTHLHCCK